MVNQLFTGTKNTYTTLRELGRGGEGQVFELVNNSTQVLKIYGEPLTQLKISKLLLMARLTGDALRQYAAWPDDVVANGKGQVVGFTMQKLVDYYPLHMLFSPMDRKRLFPDKGYNFLVHVARNLASAFYALHNAGLVVGDVNEGNILVNARGMIAFIDCDSFQIKDGSSYHFCEVGVPRYTPPELLEKTSFNNVVRTVNTDAFSMAVLIFQLLFLGRHPFAGKNLTTEDIEEKTAIKQHLFAYSTRHKNNRLSPPNDSFSINWLTPQLSNLFHTAFEQNAGRPLPADWVKALDGYQQSMVACGKAKIHFYPSAAGACVWCMFKEKRNILYFFDDSVLNGWQQVSDIDNFINGFKVEKLHLPPLVLPPLPPLTAQPVNGKYRNVRIKKAILIAAIIAAGIVLAFFIKGWAFLCIFLIRFLIDAIKMIPFQKRFNRERDKRITEYGTLRTKFEAIKKEYNEPAEARAYHAGAVKLLDLVNEYKALPQTLQTKRQELEEKLYTDQLHAFQDSFYIKNYVIPSIGGVRREALEKSGIVTARDISKLHIIKVQGIGPAYIQVLTSWQRQVSSNFVYHPDDALLNTMYAQAVYETGVRKKQVENEIRAQYQALGTIKSGIALKRSMMQQQAERLQIETEQARLDLEAFQLLK